MVRASRGERAARLWPLLFPASYLLHLAEEIWGGPGFVAWAARHLSAGFTRERFQLINGIAWPAMLVASLLAALRPSLRWLTMALGVIVLINGVLHIGSTLVTGSYSPGVVSGTLVYLPLGTLSLVHGARAAPGRVALAVALGVAIHALVALVAFGLDRPR